MSRAGGAARVGGGAGAAVAAVFTVVAAGCERAGPDAAWALQSAQDTVVARRIEIPLKRAPAPSPDGKTFAGIGDNGDLVIASLDGTMRHLAPTTREAPWGPPGYVQQIAFSRDGARIAYSWYNAESDRALVMDLRVIDASGGEPRVLHRAAGAVGYVTPVDWSPDGRLIAVIETVEDATARIVLVPVDGGEPHLVRALDWREPKKVGFSPDGRYLAYDRPLSDESHERGLFVYDLENGRERAILAEPGSRTLIGWARDGQLIYNELSGTPAVWGVEMESGQPRGEPRLLKPDFWRSTGLGVTATGDLYYTVQTGGSAAAAATLDPVTGRATGAPRLLTSRGEPVNFESWGASQDGRLLSFQHATLEGGVAFGVRPLDGGEVRDFPLPVRIRYGLRVHRWLPDGTGIVFRGAEQSRYGLFRLDMPSGAVHGPLDVPMPNPGTFAFDITPDGRGLVYRAQLESEAGGRREEIRVRDLHTEQERVVAVVEGWGDGQAQPLAVSEDGRFVAFHDPKGRYRNMETDSAGALRRAGDVDLLIVPFSGGESRVIARTGGGPILWTGDGRALLVGDNALGNEVVRIPLDGGAPSKLGIRTRTLIHVDDEGRRLLYVDEGEESRFELWLLQLGGAR